MSLNHEIATLIAYAEKYLELNVRDALYARNRILDILGLSSYTDEGVDKIPELPDGILQGIFACLDEEGKEYDKATLGEKLMDAVMPRPSEYEEKFESKYSSSAECATDWAYRFAIASDYVKKSAIDKNLKWTSKDGTIEITINLSKPEKNNKDLQKQLKVASSDYPKCTICRENEGFERPGFSRRNMRTHSLTLNKEAWFWQYSPYAYFNEHGIAISVEHTPMVLNEGTAEKLFDFVEQFPHYFIGNNAPLPRVGGSILMHNHYQGGHAVLPMQRVGIKTPLSSRKYPSVKAGIVDWYNTAIRLEGDDRHEIAALAKDIFTAWETYDNPALDILSHTGEERHNTASLIARRGKESKWILDIILRNNRVDDRYPGGIFHAHQEYHAIKSESIGLIEAMGLFILPARLKRQLTEIRTYLTGEKPYSEAALGEDMKIFVPMIQKLTAGGKVPAEKAEDMLRDEVESTCKHILDNTAVFKHDAAGESALVAFLKTSGLSLK